jgi:hypothetical protein
LILEINNLLWLKTPRGEGVAKFLIDYGPESDLYWVVFLENGEVWTYSNRDVKAVSNETLGRP